MKKNIQLLWIYLAFLGKEMISPLNYFMALLIGIVINYLQGNPIFASFVPFLVPVVVQSLSKSSVKFGNRNLKLLVRLPMEKKDPAFVINPKGDIIVKEGKTKSLFKEYNITTMQDIFNDNTNNLATMIEDSCNTDEYRTSDLYSLKLNKWYKVHTKRDSFSENLLVWMEDITLSKKLSKKLSQVKDFTKEIIINMHVNKQQISPYNQLAEFVLHEGYGGILIADKTAENELKGRVYKLQGKEIVKSDDIIISEESNAPIWNSRTNESLVSDSVNNYSSREEFEKQRPFDKNVKEFLACDIQNFINYHEEDVSIIVFNKKTDISAHDLSFIESIVSTAFLANFFEKKAA